MNVTEMTRKDFERLPWRESWSGEGICDQIVILPAQIPRWRFWWHRLRVFVARALRLHEPEEWESIPRMHDSGWRCMDYVAIVDGEAVCRLAGGSDVLHIEGIGGYGYNWLRRFNDVPRFVHIAGWSFDCLPKSGLLRLWPDSKIIYGTALSSFEIYSMPPDTKELWVNDILPWQEDLDKAKMLLGEEI